MRYLRHRRHSNAMNYERHGDAFQADINGPLTVSIPTTESVATGAALSVAGTVTGGFAPYTHVWKKDGVVVSGQAAATFTKASAVSGDAGSYVLESTDAKGTKVVSAACVVTVTA